MTFFEILQGVKQGCALSSTLFNLYMVILIEELRKTNAGVKLWDGTTIPALLYADDCTILAETRDDLIKQIKKYEAFCKKYRVSTNIRENEIYNLQKGGKR